MYFFTIFTIFVLITSPVIISSNFLVFAAYLRFKRLRTPSNGLIISLTLADFGIGIILPASLVIDLRMPIMEENGSSYINSEALSMSIGDEDEDNSSHTQMEMGPFCNVSYCLAIFSVLLTFCSASVLSMSGIALDRFTSVSQPLRYNHFVKTSYVHRYVFFIWLYSISIGATLPTLFRDNNIQMIIFWCSILIYIPCLISTLLSYSYIYIVARNHARAIYSVEISLNNGGDCEIIDTSSMHHNRYFLTLGLLLCGILSWSPIQICAWSDLFGSTSIISSQNSRILLVIPIVIFCTLNPFLYGYRSSEIRMATVRLIESIIVWITGRPAGFTFLSPYKGEVTSCGSNIRLLAVSPTQTTCHNPSNVENDQPSLHVHSNSLQPPSPTIKKTNNLQIILCDQTVTSL